MFALTRLEVDALLLHRHTILEQNCKLRSVRHMRETCCLRQARPALAGLLVVECDHGDGRDMQTRCATYTGETTSVSRRGYGGLLRERDRREDAAMSWSAHQRTARRACRRC
jgi:hypothetical protein